MRRAVLALVLVALALAAAPVGAAPIPVGSNACSFAGQSSVDPVNTCEFTADAGPHFYFTELDSLRVYLDNNNNNRWDVSADTDLLAAYSGSNHRVDPGPLFDRTEQPAGTYEVATGKTVRVEAYTNGGNYLGGYFVK